MTPALKELYGLIGHPVKHSYSAFMHNAAFAHLKLEAEYQLFDVPPEELEHFFKETIKEKQLKGFNVTVPHKEAAVAYLNASVSPTVLMNQAANTVRVEPDGTLSGFNTDGAGFALDLKERGCDVADKKVSLLGAGGGAKAVATAVAAGHPRRLLIYDLDRTRADQLHSIVNRFFPHVVVSVVPSLQGLDVASSDILINATPVGMRQEDPLLIDENALRPGLFVYDLIYNPPETKLLAAARRAGCRTANGLGMLLYQGCLAFEYWTGRPAPVEVMRQALSERLHA